MALAIGTKTYDINTPGALSRTFSHSQDSGSDKYLFVIVAMSNAATVTGVTYGGVAMTLKARHVPTAYSSDWTMWELANPASGANNVVVSFNTAQYNPVSTIAVSATGCSGFGQTGWGDTGYTDREISLTGLVTTSKLLIAGFAGNNSGSIKTGTSSPATNVETRLWNHNTNNYHFGGLSSITLASTTYIMASATTEASLFVSEIKEAAAVVTRKRFHIT